MKYIVQVWGVISTGDHGLISEETVDGLGAVEQFLFALSKAEDTGDTVTINIEITE